MRRLLGTSNYVPFIAVVVAVLMATGAAFGIVNLTSGHPGHPGVTAARADHGGDSDGGPQGPWTSFYAKESSGRPITMAELHAAARQAAAIPNPDTTPWQPIGPTNVGGRVVDLVVDPSNPTTIYIAAAGGGIWKSTDEGMTFTSVWPSDYTQTMGALAIGSDGTLWAGTGEANPAGGGMTYFGNGVYKSTDGGQTWQNVGLTGSAAIGKIVVNPNNPNEVWVAAAGSIYTSSPQRGIYHTTDGGQTWQLALAPPNATTGGIDIALDPANPNRVYAALWDHHRDPAARTYGGVGSGLFRSDDDGATWTRLQNITTPLPSYDRAQTGLASDPSLGRIGVAVAPTDPNRVYVISGDTNGFDKGFFVSNDGGDSFQTAGHANNESEYQWWFGRIWVDPGNENHVFVADVSLRQSFDGGQTWSSLRGVHADQHTMAWDPSTVNPTDQSAERIYLGNDGGIYHTDSDGTTNASWVHATYEPWNQTYHIAVAADNDNRLATGMQDNGSVRTWTAANPSPTDTSQFNAYGGGDGHYVAIDQTNEKIYYACSQNGFCGGIQDNSDGTQTQLPFGPHLATATRFTADAPLVIDPTNPSVLYLGGNVLARSTDRGATWTQISPSDPNDLPGPPPPEEEQDPVYANSYATISAVAPATTNPDPNGYASTIYVGTDTGYLWKTTDAGQTWTQMTGLPQLWVNSIAVDPTNANRAWVAFSGFRTGDNGSHLYETTNGGTTWTSVSGILPNAPIENVVFDSASNAIYVATDLGVFWAHVPPGGGHAPPTPLEWFRLGSALPATPDMDLKINGADTKLFVGTFGRGIWEVTLPTVHGEPPPWGGARHHPHREVLRAAAVGMTERGPGPGHLMVPGLAHDLQRGLGETQQARGADRVGAEHAAGGVDGQPAADFGLARLREPPALTRRGEAQVLQPHRLKPGERDVDLGDVDLVDGTGDAGLAPQRGCAVGPRPGVDVVLAREHGRLRAHRGRADPGHGPAAGLCGPGRRLVADDHRARAVRGRAGLVVAHRIPQHGGGAHRLQRDAGLPQVGEGVQAAVAPVLDRDHRADVLRCATAADVGANMRREIATRAGQHRHAERRHDRQGPHGVGLRLLLERDRENPAVPAGLDQAGRDVPRRAADRARRVHPQQRLAGGAEGAGEVQLGHHHALEQVGRLPHHDRVDVGETKARVGQGPVHGFPAQSGD